MFKTLNVIAITLLLLGAGGLINAGAAETAPLGGDAPDLWMAWFKMIGVLFLLLGLLLIGARLMRRLTHSPAGFFGGPELIRVIGSKALAPKKYITLVEIGGSVLTLGVSNDNITCLDKVPADDFHAHTERSSAAPNAAGFSQRLRALASGGALPRKDETS